MNQPSNSVNAYWVTPTKISGLGNRFWFVSRENAYLQFEKSTFSDKARIVLKVEPRLVIAIGSSEKDLQKFWLWIESAILSKLSSNEPIASDDILKVLQTKFEIISSLEKIQQSEAEIEFQQLFKFKEEPLLADFSCALWKKMHRQGRMYVSERHVSFHSRMLDNTVSIFIDNIKRITKEKSFLGMVPDSIKIESEEGTYYFTNFLKRDSAFSLLDQLWNVALSNHLQSAEISKEKIAEKTEKIRSLEEEERIKRLASNSQIPASVIQQQQAQFAQQQAQLQQLQHSNSNSSLKLEGERKKEFQVNLTAKKPQQATQQAYESLKKNSDFRSQFKLPHSETIFEEYSTALKGTTGHMGGVLILSSNFICFVVQLDGLKTLTVPLSEIENILVDDSSQPNQSTTTINTSTSTSTSTTIPTTIPTPSTPTTQSNPTLTPTTPTTNNNSNVSPTTSQEHPHFHHSSSTSSIPVHNTHSQSNSTTPANNSTNSTTTTPSIQHTSSTGSIQHTSSTGSIHSVHQNSQSTTTTTTTTPTTTNQSTPNQSHSKEIIYYIRISLKKLNSPRKLSFAFNSKEEAEILLKQVQTFRSIISPLADPIAHEVIRKYLTSFRNEYMESQDDGWNSYFKKWGYGMCMMKDSNTLHNLLKKGIPSQLRGCLWPVLCGAIYKWMTHPSYYSDIQAEYKNKVSPFEEEIEKDLRRAFPKHQFFQNDLNIDMLRRVLTAYAWRNPIIGYAQSMNMICGSLLFVLPEEAAFWVLVSVCEDVVPGYYNKSLAASMVDLEIFEQLIRKYFPEVQKHLESVGLSIGIVATSWFLTLFIGICSLETSTRIMDILLFEGSDILQKLGLAIVKLTKDDVLKCDEGGEIMTVYQSKISQIEHQIVDVASEDFDHPSFKSLLAELRKTHTFQVIRKIEKQNKKRFLRNVPIKQTKFTADELDKAYDIFLESQPTEQFELGRNEFSNFFKSIAPPGWRDRPDVCEAFWKYWSSKDLVDFVKIAPQLSLLLKGDLKDRLSLVLDLYDDNQDKKLHRQELMLALNTLIAMYSKEDTKPDIPILTDMIYEKYAGSAANARNHLLGYPEIVKECVDIPRLVDLFEIQNPSEPFIKC